MQKHFFPARKKILTCTVNVRTWDQVSEIRAHCRPLLSLVQLESNISGTACGNLLNHRASKDVQCNEIETVFAVMSSWIALTWHSGSWHVLCTKYMKITYVFIIFLIIIKFFFLWYSTKIRFNIGAALKPKKFLVVD